MADQRRTGSSARSVATRGLAGSDWTTEAGRILADLGFEIVTGEHPDNPTASDLVVALRDRPTLRHFDPEDVLYWTTQGGRGRPARLDRSVKVLPLEQRFAWGRISIVDRLGKMNQFISFGGVLRVAELDKETIVALFSSPAPIQRMVGRSQRTDLLTEPIGAFFGRMMIPIDFEPTAEPRISATDPLELYCAFVLDASLRLGRSPALRQAQPQLASWVSGEVRRLSAHEDDAWSSGRELVADLNLDEVR